jgi:alpha-glucoside transport system permease protein
MDINFDNLVSAIFLMISAVFACVSYFWGSNYLLDKLLPSLNQTPTKAAKNIRLGNAIRPWLFLGPALLLLTVYLIYPVFDSFRRSLMDADSSEFVGWSNYQWMLGDTKFQEAAINNLLWLIVVPAAATFLGLIIAALTDRVWWGNIAKSLIFMPMAISFIGASIIWKFIYDFRDDGDQIGLLNAIVTALGFEPQPWIQLPFWNNFFLMAILIWIQTGFAMVILSAALRGISEETIEAAVIDGANELQVFFKIMIPQIWGTIAVVWTTITILVLKVFDIVLAMTNGQWNTEVLANLMYGWMFQGGGDFGRGAAIAVVIMLAVTPIMVWNIRNASAEMKGK